MNKISVIVFCLVQISISQQINYFSLSGFGNCVLHLTSFNSDIIISDLVQNFVSANQKSIWTFTNTTNAWFPIEPNKVNEICSVNVLINSESVEWAPHFFILESIYARRDEKHSNFVIVRQKEEDLEKSLHYFDLSKKNNFSEINLQKDSWWTAKVQVRVTDSHNQLDGILRIVTPLGFHLMGFVNQVHLRVNWKPKIVEGITDYLSDCKDYLQFEGGENEMERICHDVEETDLRQHPLGLIGPRTIHSSKNNFELQVHVESSSQGTKTRTLRPKILAEITFTAFTDCWNVEEWESLRQCSKSNSFSCIHENNFCNGHINCVFEDNFGLDERNCNETETLGEKEIVSTNPKLTGTKRKSSEVEEVPQIKSEYEQIRQYFVPTAFIFFIIWGVITLIRKCYKCYRTEYGKEEYYY